MKPFFESAERVALLELCAKAWVGTPFRANSMARGHGASCVGAIVGVLSDAGFVVPPFKLVPTDWARHQTESRMEQFLDAHTESFTSLDWSSWSDIQKRSHCLMPGDVVGFKAGLCIHHLGLILENGRFLQCNESMGTCILSQAEREFHKRLARAWRPKQPLE